MKKTYRRIGDDFAGATLGLQKKIAELKDIIKEIEYKGLKQEIEYKDSLHKKDIELHKKDIELHKKDIENKDTVIENWKLKHQLATMTNNARN
jgi:hypothetical protein